MIRHLALFNLSSDVDETQRDLLWAQIEKFKNLRSVRSVRIGRLLTPREAWYRPRMAVDFEWMLTIDFDDEDSLYEFQTDEYHLSTAREIRKRVSSIKVLDFVL